MRWTAALTGGALLLAGCSGPAARPASTPAGCGLVREATVVGLTGGHTQATLTGSVADLRARHRTLTCRTTVPGHPERYVTVRADFHPAPLQLPSTGCSAGWVYAGTPDKFTPACQDTVDGHGRTRLLVRWQPYVVRVTVGRSDRQWGGDPELALAMSRTLAQRLGVAEAAGDG